MEKPVTNANQNEVQLQQPVISDVFKEQTPKTSKKQRESALAYYYANREAVRAHYKNLPDDIKERRRIRTRLWRAANKPIKAQYDKQWRENHREQWLALSRKHRKTPKARLIHNLRRRLRDFVYLQSSRKSHDYGCTPKQLRAHIEKQFQNGMSWSNYGEWHIDHIVPCKMFNLSLESHRALCFNWRNLRPLAGGENMRRQANFVSTDMAFIDDEFMSLLKNAKVL